jgi:hypothetical protein
MVLAVSNQAVASRNERDRTPTITLFAFTNSAEGYHD